MSSKFKIVIIEGEGSGGIKSALQALDAVFEQFAKDGEPKNEEPKSILPERAGDSKINP